MLIGNNKSIKKVKARQKKKVTANTHKTTVKLTLKATVWPIYWMTSDISRRRGADQATRHHVTTQRLPSLAVLLSLELRDWPKLRYTVTSALPRGFPPSPSSSSSSSLSDSSSESLSMAYVIKRRSGEEPIFVSSWPGGSMWKPKKLKTRRRDTLSDRVFLKQITTLLHFSFSSAYSSSVTRLSLDPSGRMPGDNSMYKVLFLRVVSQHTSSPATGDILKVSLAPSCKPPDLLLSEMSRSFNKLVILTGGAFKTPTSLPSAKSVRHSWATWGTSGPPQRPWAQRYSELGTKAVFLE